MYSILTERLLSVLFNFKIKKYTGALIKSTVTINPTTDPKQFPIYF